MGVRVSQAAEINGELFRALLTNAPAVAEIAEQLGLSPRDVTNIIHETLLQYDEYGPTQVGNIPIMAQNPPEFSCMNPGGMALMSRGIPKR